ncbi:ribosomal protein S12 methylthiotransferase accessory factor [Enterococcus rotai]|uniref:YcaO domain-containing protein n=1 Tax=Enterococcus rotai TaxID=118060 RepID=A0A0U2WVK9_9ENTE|nr:YcaO-like family protein [Enterococcus rotai]ALS37689.1 hypothetical protein ATZ35_11165 [Enterococcus rotai]
MDRHKEFTAKDTIKNIIQFLEKNKIKVVEKKVKNTAGFYSILIQVQGTTLFTNGKGTTEEYAKASAYGELVERILTGVLFRFHAPLNDQIVEKNASWVLTSHQQEYSIIAELIGYPISRENVLSLQNNFFEISRQFVVSEEYTRLDNGMKEKIPLGVLDTFFGSNGMAFGNTFYEASVQALSEIFERNANKQIIEQNKIVPTIENWEQYSDKELTEKINILLEKESLRLLVKDCTFNNTIPVLAIILFRDNGQYFVKFGSHFTFTIALERCFTEFFQGRNIEDYFWKDPVYSNDKEFYHLNLQNIIRDGDGYYHLGFLNQGEILNEIQFDFGTNNETAYKKYISILKEMGHIVLCKDYSIEKQIVVRYLVSQFSYVEDQLDILLKRFENYRYQTESILNFLELSSQKRKKFLHFLKKINIDEKQSILSLLKKPIPKYSELSFLNVQYLIGIDKLLDGNTTIEVDSYFVESSKVYRNYLMIKEKFAVLLEHKRIKEAIYKYLFFPKIKNDDIYINSQKISYVNDIRVLQSKLLTQGKDYYAD